MNHLLDWHLLGDDVWESCLSRALEHAGERRMTRAAHGKHLGLLFFNDSLRTRVSMELAARELGADAVTVVPGQGTWGFAWGDGPMTGGEAEHIREAVGVLSRYVDALGVRLFASGTNYAADRDELRFKAIVEAASVPVVNLESAFYHPCQALADATTIRQQLGGDLSRRKFVLSWCTHPKPLPMAVPNSALLAASRLGMDVTVLRPEGFDLDEGVMETARSQAERAGGRISVTDDRKKGFDGADIVYAKAWGGTSRYEDSASEEAARLSHADWRVTEGWMERTRAGKFMHCLPVRRGVVVDDAVLDSPRAIHLDQAENRLHAQKAILEWVWGLKQDSIGGLAGDAGRGRSGEAGGGRSGEGSGPEESAQPAPRAGESGWAQQTGEGSGP